MDRVRLSDSKPGHGTKGELTVTDERTLYTVHHDGFVVPEQVRDLDGIWVTCTEVFERRVTGTRSSGSSVHGRYFDRAEAFREALPLLEQQRMRVLVAIERAVRIVATEAK